MKFVTNLPRVTYEIKWLASLQDVNNVEITSGLMSDKIVNSRQQFVPSINKRDR